MIDVGQPAPPPAHTPPAPVPRREPRARERADATDADAEPPWFAASADDERAR